MFRRIFNVNNAILAFAVAMMIMAIHFILQSINDGFDKLIPHRGIMESKHLSYKYSTKRNSYVDRDEPDSVPVFNFKIADDPRWYTVSWFPMAADNLIEVGDSIEFYTKEVTSDLGNLVSDGKGRSWNTTSPNEVFHLVSNKYPSPIVDFYEYRSKLRGTVWIWPLFSLVFFGWYFYRRSGRKSPLVTEYSRIE